MGKNHKSPCKQPPPVRPSKVAVIAAKNCPQCMGSGRCPNCGGLPKRQTGV